MRVLRTKRVLPLLAHRSPINILPFFFIRRLPLCNVDVGVGAVIAIVFSSLQVVSSTRIVLFVRVRPASPDQRQPQPLKMVAIDTGAGAVQLNPEDGGVALGTLVYVPFRASSPPLNHKASKHKTFLPRQLFGIGSTRVAQSFGTCTTVYGHHLASLAGHLRTRCRPQSRVQQPNTSGLEGGGGGGQHLLVVQWRVITWVCMLQCIDITTR